MRGLEGVLPRPPLRRPSLAGVLVTTLASPFASQVRGYGLVCGDVYPTVSSSSPSTLVQERDVLYVEYCVRRD